MVLISMKVDSQGDPFTRILAIWLDRAPPLDWTHTIESQNTALFKTFVTKFGTPKFETAIPDGKHSIYVAISQASNSKFGPWKVSTTLDGVVAPDLSTIDFDTIGKYDFVVKGGKVASAADQAKITEIGDLNNKDPWAMLKKFVADNKNTLFGVAVGATVLTTAGIIAKGGGKKY